MWNYRQELLKMASGKPNKLVEALVSVSVGRGEAREGILASGQSKPIVTNTCLFHSLCIICYYLSSQFFERCQYNIRIVEIDLKTLLIMKLQ